MTEGERSIRLSFFGREVAFAPPPFPNLPKSLSHGAATGLVTEVAEVAAAPCPHCSQKNRGRKNLGWLSLSQLQTGTNGTVTTLMMCRTGPSPPTATVSQGGKVGRGCGASWASRGSPCLLAPAHRMQGWGQSRAGWDPSTTPVQPHLHHGQGQSIPAPRFSCFSDSFSFHAPREWGHITSNPSFWETLSSQQSWDKTCSISNPHSCILKPACPEKVISRRKMLQGLNQFLPGDSLQGQDALPQSPGCCS